MSRIKNQPLGRTIQGAATNDIDQKLTYQQLIKLNRDLAKQNLQLKNIGTRLGNQLKSLHMQFEIKPREQNTELYKAIGASPQLHQFESTLIPLLQAYENKIQEFEHGFETMHEEFFLLQKKFEQICRENEELKANLTDKSKQLIEVYRNGVSGSMQADFGHLILEQINEKQKLLVEENHVLEKNHQKSSAEAERMMADLMNLKEKQEDIKKRLHQKQIQERQLSAEVQNLKETNLELQIKNNQLESEKRKIMQAHQRAQSLNNQINKDKEFYMSKLQELRKKIETDKSIPNQNHHIKKIEELQNKIAFMQAEHGPNDNQLKLTKLQKQYEKIKNERKQLKQVIDNMKLEEESLRKQLVEEREKKRVLETQKSQLQVNENRLKRSLQNLTQKSKSDILRAKKDNKNEIQRLEYEYKIKLDTKDRKILQLDQNLEKIRLERDKFEKEISLYSGKNVDTSKNKGKQNDRVVNKMKDKLKAHEDFFKEQTQMYERQLKQLRVQHDSIKADNKSKAQQLKKLKMMYDQLQQEYEDIRGSKQILIGEFKNVRDQYQITLKEKERIFDEKIMEIKSIVQQSESKRRAQRERVQEASKEYKRVLEDIKNAYEARIRQLQSQVSQVHYQRIVTPI